MKYRVFEEWLPQNWENGHEVNLFSRRGYWEVQIKAISDDISLIPLLVKDEKNSIVSFWCFSTDGQKWKTPLNAPYFEPYCSSQANIKDLFVVISRYLKEKLNLPIQWKLPPHLHLIISDYGHEFLQTVQLKNIVVSHFLTVNRLQNFTEVIKQERKRRKLSSLLKTDFKVFEPESGQWELLYKQLLSWRESKGHQNLMSSTLMKQSKAAFPNFYRCLQLSFKGKTAGLAFFMQADFNSFYIYSLITEPKFNQLQPSLLLWNAIYELAKKEGISHLDLGTSMLANGKINRGLFRFKLALGASTTKKITIVC